MLSGQTKAGTRTYVRSAILSLRQTRRMHLQRLSARTALCISFKWAQLRQDLLFGRRATAPFTCAQPHNRRRTTLAVAGYKYTNVCVCAWHATPQNTFVAPLATHQLSQSTSQAATQSGSRVYEYVYTQTSRFIAMRLLSLAACSALMHQDCGYSSLKFLVKCN